jgi:hypothetical protein
MNIQKIYPIFLLFVCFFLISNTSTALTIQYNDSIVNESDINRISNNNDISKISKIIEMVNESQVLDYLEDLVEFSPRKTGTYGCIKAGEYIYDKFVEFGLDAKSYDWISFGNKYNPRFFTGQNIEGTLYGNNKSNEIIIFNAHYDSVLRSPGADDDGSGVAAVLAAANVLSNFEFDRTIKFICFSGEEEGLLGSKDYANNAYKNNNRIIVEFNADMIGYAQTEDDENKFRIYGSDDINWFVDVIEDLNIEYDFNFDITRGILSPDRRGGSDYFSFLRYGLETIAFFEGSWNQNMHSEDDTIENMNIPYLTKTSRLIIASIAYISDMLIEHPFIYIDSPQKGSLYFENRNILDLCDKRNDQIRTIVIDSIWIYTEIYSEINTIDKVEFYYNGRIQFTDEEYPYKWNLNKFSIFNNRIEVIVYDSEGNTASDWIDVLFINPRIRG